MSKQAIHFTQPPCRGNTVHNKCMFNFVLPGDSGDGESKEKNNTTIEILNESDGIKHKENALNLKLCEKSGDVALQNTSDNGLTSNESNDDDSSNSAVDFIVVYNKNKYDITFNSNKTIKDLKAYLKGLIGVPEELQKVMFKGLAKDEQTLKDLDVKNGAKVMVVGSKLDQVNAVKTGSPQVTLWFLLYRLFVHLN